MKQEIEVIKKQSHNLLTKKDDIIEELNNHKVARTVIGTDNLICTISIIKKPKDKSKGIRLFQELDKMQGIMK